MAAFFPILAFNSFELVCLLQSNKINVWLLPCLSLTLNRALKDTAGMDLGCLKTRITWQIIYLPVYTRQ